MNCSIRIGIVGPCGSGKSEAVSKLKSRGYQVHHIAQEHSFAPRMWKQITNPDLLIFLNVSYPITLKRNKFHWSEAEYEEQLLRLRDAKTNADLIINTDDLTINQVFDKIINRIKKLDGI